MLNNLFIKKGVYRYCISIIAIFFVAILILAFVLPLCFSIKPIFSQDSFYEFSSKDISVKYILNALFFTIKQAFFSTLIALIIGIPMGFFVAKRNFFFKKFFVSLSAIPFCVPALLVALAYVQFFGINGNLNKFIKSLFDLESSPITFLYSFVGIVIVQGFYNFPLVMKTCSDIWSKIDSRQEDAALLLGANPIKRFFSITIHQISTAISSSAITVFFYCFFSFIIVLLFGAVGCTTIEVEIYQSVKNTLNYKVASILALIETFTALILCLIVLSIEKKSSKNRSLRCENICIKLKNSFEKVFLGILVLLIIFFLIFPFVSLILSSFEKITYVLSNKNLFLSIKDSVLTAFCTASITTICALTMALFFRLNVKARKSILFHLIPILPLTISSVIVGYGLIIFLQIIDIEPNFFILAIFQSVTAFPLAFRQITNNLEKLPLNIDDVCSVFSKDFTKSIFWVYIPNVKESIYSAFAFSFAISCGDTTLPLILSIQNYNPLALYTFRLASSYQFNSSCVCGIVLLFVGSSFFIFKGIFNFVKKGIKLL